MECTLVAEASTAAGSEGMCTFPLTSSCARCIGSPSTGCCIGDARVEALEWRCPSVGALAHAYAVNSGEAAGLKKGQARPLTQHVRLRFDPAREGFNAAVLVGEACQSDQELVNGMDAALD